MKNTHTRRVQFLSVTLGTLAAVGVFSSQWGSTIGQVNDGFVCGDGNLSRYEECEDGNQLNGDGCSNACLTENKPSGVRELTWRSGGGLGYRVGDNAFVSALGKLWIIGGRDLNSRLGTSQAYSTTDGYTWDLESNLPERIYAASAIEWNGELWVVGGMRCNMFGRLCAASRATYHSSDGRTWLPGPQLPVGIRTYNTPLYVFNGKLFLGLTSVKVLSNATGSWQAAGTGFGGSVVVLGNRVLALNGRNIMSSPTGVAPWTRESILPSPLSTNVQLSVANAANLMINGNYILALGNTSVPNRNPSCDKVVLSSDNGIRWAKTSTPTCSTLPQYAKKAVTFLNRVWIFTDRTVSFAELPAFFPACGDGTVHPGEECDDGNQTNTDACTNICKNAVCGDSAIGPNETCDDGNTNNLDGCTNNCHLIACGDGVKEGQEQCDDGNIAGGDGCSSSCWYELGFSCAGETRSICTRLCSNGVIAGNEQCDDQNLNSGDGCSSLCAVESGFTCLGTPSTCTPIVCGNGLTETGEECDDGNVNAGNGCSATCTIESGFTCSGSPSTCTPIVCGNSRKEPGETCDDGNTSNTIGWCPADCTKPQKLSCAAPANASLTFTQSVIDTAKGEQVVTGDFDGSGTIDVAVRDGTTVKIFKKTDSGFSLAWSSAFTSGDRNDRGYIEAFDPSGATHTQLVALMQRSIYPNLSNPLPGYHENNHYIISMGTSGVSAQNLSWLRRSSRAGERFVLTKPNGFLGSIYRGMTPTTAYQPLEYISILGNENSLRRILSFDDGFGLRALWQYQSVSRSTLASGKHVIGVRHFIIDDATNIVTTLQIDEVASALEVGDVNSDGVKDIVALIYKQSTGGYSKAMWWNPANGTWSFIADVAWIKPVFALGDIDGDGDTDLAVRAYAMAQGSAYWLEQNNGAWIKHMVQENGVLDLALADMTGDGRPDFVLATPTGTVLYTQLQECITPSVCGNGTKERDEACDDGSTVTGDGCSALCTVETGYSCTGEPLSVCTLNCGNGSIQLGEACDDGDRDAGDGCSALCTTDSGYFCTGIPSVCALFCGNGVINTGESCDDGNSTSGDGCSTCTVDTGFQCLGTPSVCSLLCGNGQVTVGEGCDDGSRFPNDGCNALCQVEIGYRCEGSPSICVIPSPCGNGVKQSNEQCDDNNIASGDGCSALCVVEAGYSCTGTERSTCTRNCGNGVKQESEQCDDQNIAAGDGCSALCTIESGYSCAGTPRSTCSLICGNGTIQAGESCDDNNRTAGDGCSLTCSIETGYSCSGSPSICILPPALPLTQACNSTQSHLSLGAITRDSRLTGVVVASHRDEAYGIVGVTQSSGILIPTVYRYTKVNQTPVWVLEARLSPIDGASTFASPGAVLIKTGGKLYAIRRGRSGEVSEPGSAGHILRRTGGGTWEDLGTPWQTSAPPVINSILEFQSSLYAVHNGRVYQYNGGRSWAAIGSVLSNPVLLASTNERLYVIGSASDGTATISTMHRLEGSNWVPDTGASTLRRISGVVGAGNALLILGKHDASNSATEPLGVYRYQPGADVPLVDTRVETTPTTALSTSNPLVLPPQLFSIGDKPFAFIKGTSLLQYNLRAKIWQDTGLWGVSNPRSLDEGPLMLSTSLTFQTEFKSAQVVCKKLAIPFCGNGTVEFGETCDDTNESNTDGCTNACRLPACGDGFMQGTEECDDGNLLNEDACTSECKVDPNWCAPGSCTLPVSLSEKCTDSVNPVALGTFKKLMGTSTSIASFNNAAYMATDNTIRRLMRNGDRVSWVTEVRIPSSGITLKSLHGTLYAVIAAPYGGSVTAADSMVYRRNANGQWEGLGTPFVSTNVVNPNAPNIVNLLEHNGVLYAAVRNYGNVYRYNNDHTWSHLGQNIAIAANTQGLLQLKAAVWGGNTLYAIIDVPPTTGVSTWNGTSWQSVGAAMPETTFQAMEASGQAFVVGLPRFVTNFMVYRMNAETPNSFLTAVYFRPGSLPSFVSADNELFASNGIGSIVHFGGIDTLFATRQSNNDPAYTVNDGSLLLSAPVDTTSRISPSCKKLVLSVCRNGVVERGEECDDNNAINTDSCTNACKLPACGDGVMQGTEVCDDGNRTAGDGCNASCAIEPDYTCSGTSPSVCLPTCGNGVINTGEACDDRNRTAGDGCNLTCNIEGTHTCSGAPSTCVRICGNGVLNPGEGCDDGNANANDGCVSCIIAEGYTCSGAPSACVRNCGNGTVNAGEQCDDAGATAFCTAACTFAPKVCGDGIVQNGEQCDDGNQDYADGCSSMCKLPVCRNGIREGTEECDDNNASNTDSCTNACKNAKCGDTFIQPGSEQCDDGNQVNTDACSNACNLARCGDSLVQTSEQCDDGNTLVNDGCTPVCTTSPVVSSLCGIGSFKAMTLPSPTATQHYQSISFFYPTANMLFLADDAQVSYFNNVSWRSAGVKENIVDPSGFSTNTRNITTQTALYLDEETQTLYLGTHSGDTWKQQVQGTNMEGTWHFLGRLPVSVASFTKKNGKIYAFSGKSVWEASTSWEFTYGLWTSKAVFPNPGTVPSRTYFADHDTLVQTYNPVWPSSGAGYVSQWTGNGWNTLASYNTNAEAYGGAVKKDGTTFISFIGISSVTPSIPGATFMPLGNMTKGMFGAYDIRNVDTTQTTNGILAYPLWQKIQGIDSCQAGTSSLSCISSDDFTDWKGGYWKFNADAGLSCMKMP